MERKGRGVCEIGKMKIEETYKIATGGAEPSAQTVLQINRSAQAIGMDDPIGLALMTVFRAQLDHIENIPKVIKHVTNELTNELESNARKKADAVMADAVAAAIPKLTESVVKTSQKIAGDRSAKDKLYWLCGTAIACMMTLAIAAWGGFTYAAGQITKAGFGYKEGYENGYKKGREEGYASIMSSKTLEDWTKTKEGNLALIMLFNGQLGPIVRCKQKGWTTAIDDNKKHWCLTKGGGSWLLPEGFDQ